MTDTTQGAAATLARTKRIEIQHFADGGSVRRTTVKNFGKPSGAAALMAQMPASHAGAKPMEHGGAVHGPGGPTSDAVPIWASAGEFMLPADTTAAVGKQKLEALVDATHTPTNKAAEKMGRLARADGGPIDDQLGAVTRVGNSYSGGNVSGNITVNGQAPGGTVSAIDASRAPPVAVSPPVLGAPKAVMPMFPKAVAPAAVGVPTPLMAPIGGASSVGPADYADRNAAFNAGASARTAMSSQLGSARPSAATPAAAPAVPPTPAAAELAKPPAPVKSVLGYADGGVIDDPQKKAAQDAAARLAAFPAVPPGMTTVAPPGAPGASQIPTGRELYPIAAPAPVSQVPAAAAPAPAPAPVAVVPAPVVQSTAQARLATMPAAPDAAPSRANPLGGLADTNAQVASLQASNASLPQGGATIIDGAAVEADRRAQFNEQANLRNALNSSVMTRRGAVPNEAAVGAALVPIDARAKMAAVTAKEAGDTQRATIQERGTDARAKLADTRAQQELGINQQRLSLEGKKVTLDANRDDRAAAAAEPALALAQRKASLQSVVADPNSTPAQRQAAAQQIAGMEGKELTGHAAPAGYERTPDGNLKFIKGGPADPDTPKGKNNLTDTQGKALQFGSRMQEANTIFDDLEKKGKLFSTVGANNNITGPLVNQLNSAEGQQLDQAKRNFLNAVLRRESGAVISDAEFENGAKQYFPAVGDSEEVIKQKRENRLLSTRGILAEVPDSERRVADVRGTPPPPAKAASAADVASLPSGATFVGPDGKTRRKP